MVESIRGNSFRDAKKLISNFPRKKGLTLRKNLTILVNARLRGTTPSQATRT